MTWALTVLLLLACAGLAYQYVYFIQQLAEAERSISILIEDNNTLAKSRLKPFTVVYNHNIWEANPIDSISNTTFDTVFINSLSQTTVCVYAVDAAHAEVLADKLLANFLPIAEQVIKENKS